MRKTEVKEALLHTIRKLKEGGPGSGRYPRDPNNPNSRYYVGGPGAGRRGQPQEVPGVPGGGEETPFQRASANRMVDEEELGRGISNPLKIRFEGTNELAVYKPVSREHPYWAGRREMMDGTAADREAMAYALDQIMELGLVAETYIRDGPKGRGSVQKFIHGKDGNALRDEETQHESTKRGWEDLFFFDILVCNTDRHDGNWRRESGTGKIWAVDNGYILPKGNHGTAENLIFHPDGGKAGMMRVLPSLRERHARALDSLVRNKATVDALFSRYKLRSSARGFWDRVQRMQRYQNYNVARIMNSFPYEG